MSNSSPGTRRRLEGVFHDLPSQAMDARRVAELEGAVGVGRPGSAEAPDAWFPPGIRSRRCSQAQLREPWYEHLCAELGERPRADRKQWERAYIVHPLDCLGMLEPGRSGVGFGVGREPLIALFAGRGCQIVATDLPPTVKEARPWVRGGRHGGVDDRGVAVHTTASNVASNDATIDSGLTVHPRRDLEALAAALEAAGHHVAALSLDRCREVLDEYVVVPPYIDDPHLTISLKGHATTSAALVVRAGDAPTGGGTRR